MATLGERVGDRALAGAIEMLRGCGIRVDETLYFKRDDRFVLIRALDYAWQWIVDLAKQMEVWIEKRLIRPLFSYGPLRQVVTLFPQREGDFHGGLNAFLHLEQIAEVMLRQFSSLAFAIQRMPEFAAQVRSARIEGFDERESLDEALGCVEMDMLLHDPVVQREVIAHLRGIKEWEIFLDECEAARKEGDVLTPHIERFLRDCARLQTKSVDVVDCFYQALAQLPYTPDFFGFEVEMGRKVAPQRHYIPPPLPKRGGADERRGSDELHPLPDPLVTEIELRAQPMGVITLPFRPGAGVGFNELMRRYFSPGDPVTRWIEDGVRRSETQVTERRRYFMHLPTDVYIPLRRLCQMKWGHKPGKLSFYRDRLHVPFEISLPEKRGSHERSYRLVECVAFLGTVELGNYAYYKKVGNQWYECIDARTRFVTESEVRTLLIDRTVLHHYQIV